MKDALTQKPPSPDCIDRNRCQPIFLPRDIRGIDLYDPIFAGFSDARVTGTPSIRRGPIFTRTFSDGK